MSTIEVKGKKFEILIEESMILSRIKGIAAGLKRDLQDKNPLFIAVLNGSFIFAADLFKELDFACNISFIKAASYQGTQSSGKVSMMIGLQEDLENRHVVILEDIIDTGLTVSFLLNEMKEKNPASLSVCSLLIKPDAFNQAFKVNYLGFEVENRFLIGYGLDFDGVGRNLRHVYVEE